MIYVGLDLGQRNDYTAIAQLERSIGKDPQMPGRGVPVFTVTTLDRVRLESYEKVCADVATLMGSERLRPIRVIRGGRYVWVPQSVLVVDATGVGAAIMDILGARGLQPHAISITGGINASRPDYFDHRVPKRDLVVAIQLLLENRQLKVAADLPHAETLKQELRNFRYKLSDITGNDTYGAGRDGEHDDLVLAVAVAAWFAKNEPVGATMSNYIRDPEPEAEWHPDSIYHPDHPRNPYR